MPGGGPFADTVRRLYGSIHLSEQSAHRMAILAMDQYGLLLHDLCRDSILVWSREDADDACRAGRLPILLPSKIFWCEESIPASWDVTSDSLAAYIALWWGVRRLILVKDVDGVYTSDPATDAEARLLSSIKLNELSGLRCIDAHLPTVLSRFAGECLVVNGLQPKRVLDAIDGLEVIGTMIVVG